MQAVFSISDAVKSLVPSNGDALHHYRVCPLAVALLVFWWQQIHDKLPFLFFHRLKYSMKDHLSMLTEIHARSTGIRVTTASTTAATAQGHMAIKQAEAV